MATRRFDYHASIAWTGDRGTGTSGYRAYGRDHVIRIAGKPDIAASSDPAFRGDPDRHTPEDMLVASLSSCHMLWYLHLCSDAGIVVTAYQDDAAGVMEVGADGGGRFVEVVLHPRVTLADPARADDARALHAPAHEKCFIARSVNFPVRTEPAFTPA
jgi:organic hydroperoxide reductase OsmC/OhrA